MDKWANWIYTINVVGVAVGWSLVAVVVGAHLVPVLAVI